MNHYEEQEARKAALKDWLMSLKEGDEVAIPDRSRYNRAPHITTVLRVTATQIVVKEYAQEVRYNRYDGTRRGTGFATLKPVTDEVRAQVKRANDCDWLRTLTLRDADIEKIPPYVLGRMRDAYNNSMALHNTTQHHEGP
ncbi:hypothetical protein M0D69_13815 [Caballeronia sp. SEWSISQ10-4 2]|uniref:hypothetical protein n=1 Tax=Caballeronia sp. SEWSISQ10-4 2 TaxID=2937438 RepID=UPI002651F162|nr:hypothetical protein [Caballeronia sp. SEWSISQ10-4 2]MDN7179070.1 hypothetical protein [Caballeronia sp. SEWSISQ10-4 2]